MKRWVTILGGLAAIASGVSSLRCAPVVLDPVHGTGGGTEKGSASGGGNESGSGSGGGNTNALAILAKDVPMVGSDSYLDHGITGYVGCADPQDCIDGDTLLILFSNRPPSCATAALPPTCLPEGEVLTQGGLAIPPALVRPGPIDLIDPGVFQVRFQWTGNGTCSPTPDLGDLSGGTSGTVDILSTDSGSITVDLVTPIVDASGNTLFQGKFTAMRCEPAPPLPPPNKAVVLRGSSLPAGLPANPTIGASPDPNALYVFLSSTYPAGDIGYTPGPGPATQTCSDPLASLGCNDTGRMVFKIPAALQKPGTIQLSDPELAASVEIGPIDAASCGQASTALTVTNGSVTIQSADANGITFSLFQTNISDSLTTHGPFDADGLYQASICP